MLESLTNLSMTMMVGGSKPNAVHAFLNGLGFFSGGSEESSGVSPPLTCFPPWRSESGLPASADAAIFDQYQLGTEVKGR